MTDQPHPLAGAVKPLEWVKHPDGSHWSALTITGTLYLATSDGWRHSPDQSIWHEADNLEAAKDAAQADYEALSAPTPPAYEGSDAEADAISRSIAAMQTIGDDCPTAPADVAGLVQSQPGEFDLAELFATIEWKGRRYVPEELHSELVDRNSTLSARVAELEGELARMQRMRDIYRQEWEAARAREEIAATKAKVEPAR